MMALQEKESESKHTLNRRELLVGAAASALGAILGLRQSAEAGSSVKERLLTDEISLKKWRINLETQEVQPIGGEIIIPVDGNLLKKQKVLKQNIFYEKEFDAVSGFPYGSNIETEAGVCEWGNWRVIGPVVPKEEWRNDGGRACWVSKDGRKAIYATWQHGVHFMEDGSWYKLPITDDFGISRHILKVETDLAVEADGLFVVVADLGVQLLKRIDRTRFEVRNVRFFNEGEGFFFQAGCLCQNQQGGLDLLMGGMDVLYRIKNFDKGENQWEIQYHAVPRFFGPEGDKAMMVRSVLIDQNQPQTYFIGGWWERSGWEYTGEAKVIKPGAGVWRSTDAGENWEQILKDVNVNALFDAGGGRLIAGAEGSGEWHKRIPDERFPSLYISFDRGSSWKTLTLNPWVWDLVSPQQAMALGPNGELIVSFWGGPVAMTNQSLPESDLGGEAITLGCTLLPYDRNDWAAGHLNVRVDSNNKKLTIATGGKNYNRPRGFSPLREISGRRRELFKTFFPLVATSEI